MDRIEQYEQPPDNIDTAKADPRNVLSHEEIINSRPHRRLHELLIAIQNESQGVEPVAPKEISALHNAFNEMLEALRADDDGMHEVAA